MDFINNGPDGKYYERNVKVVLNGIVQNLSNLSI